MEIPPPPGALRTKSGSANVLSRRHVWGVIRPGGMFDQASGYSRYPRPRRRRSTSAVPSSSSAARSWANSAGASSS
jgi:hypothetical protein